MKNKMKLMFILIFSFAFFLINGELAAQDERDQTTDQYNQQEGLFTDDERTQAYEETARNLANDLQTRINLTEEQTRDITDILIDYSEEIADVKRDHYYSNRTDMMGEDRTVRTDTDEPITEDQQTDTDNGDMLGARTTMIDAYREADENANEEIESVLEEEQIEQYIQVKRDWWQNVKDQVHSVVSNNLRTMQQENTRDTEKR